MLLVYIDAEERIFVNEEEVPWLRFYDGKLFARQSPRAVFMDAESRIFFKAPLSYMPWSEATTYLLVDSALGSEVGTYVSLGQSTLATPALGAQAGAQALLEASVEAEAVFGGDVT